MNSMKQGEIWIINLDPTVGSEIKKTRPAVIVNDNALGKLPLRLIVPLTDWKKSFELAPWMIKIEPSGLNGLAKASSADCFQIRSVSQKRFYKKIGKISFLRMDQIRSGLRKVLSIDS